MSGEPAFFDTNILVYCFDRQDERKQTIAHDLLMDHGVSGSGRISYQVSQEFAAVAIRILKEPKRVYLMIESYHLLAVGLETVGYSDRLLDYALGLWERYRFSWYDSLIVAAALHSGCGTLYTEDMQHGMEIDGLRIVNPFL